MTGNRKHRSPVLTPRKVFAAMFLVMALLAVLFFDTWCAVQCRRTGYEIMEARSRTEKLAEIRKKLRIEESRLKSPQVLGARARSEFGLVTPKPEQIVVVQ